MLYDVYKLGVLSIFLRFVTKWRTRSTGVGFGKLSSIMSDRFQDFPFSEKYILKLNFMNIPMIIGIFANILLITFFFLCNIGVN